MDITISNLTEPSERFSKRKLFHGQVKERKGKQRIGWATRQGLLGEFNSLKFQMLQDAHSPRIISGVMSQRYPPCLVPLGKLKKIEMNDLLCETHHQGSVLVVRIIGHAIKRVVVQNAVEDESGEVDCITIFNFNDTLPYDKVLARGVVLAIKEPFYCSTVDGGFALTVDHPSDMVFLEHDNHLYPEAWKLSSEKLNRSASEWKDLGNKHLKKSPKDWWAAYNCYTAGIKSLHNEDDDLKKDLLRNLSRTELELGFFDAAKADALKSLSLDANEKSDAKALYRAGCASYQLRDFRSAHDYFERVLAVSCSDPSAMAELKKTKWRLREEQTGHFDFPAMIKALLANGSTCADAADFVKRTEVRQTEDRGNGLFAAEFIPAGDLISCEKAFSTARDIDNPDSAMMDFTTGKVFQYPDIAVRSSTIQKLFHNPSLCERFFKLHSGDTTEGSVEIHTVDNMPVIDTFRVKDITKTNSFAFEAVPGRKVYGNIGSVDSPANVLCTSSTGIWIMASYMNHSCLANANRSFIGDMMILRATTAIPKGTEITITYKNRDPNIHIRRNEVKSWGFVCDCKLCQADVEHADLREVLLEKVDEFYRINRARETFPAPESFGEAENLIRKIEKTYPDSLFADLPRPALFRLHEYLALAYDFTNNASKARFHAWALIHCYGYKITVDKETKTLKMEGKNVFLGPRVVDALWALRHSSKDEVLGMQYENLARKFYVAINGDSTGFEIEYRRGLSVAEGYKARAAGK